MDKDMNAIGPWYFLKLIFVAVCAICLGAGYPYFLPALCIFLIAGLVGMFIVFGCINGQSMAKVWRVDSVERTSDVIRLIPDFWRTFVVISVFMTCALFGRMFLYPAYTPTPIEPFEPSREALSLPEDIRINPGGTYDTQTRSSAINSEKMVYDYMVKQLEAENKRRAESTIFHHPGLMVLVPFLIFSMTLCGLKYRRYIATIRAVYE